jgi:UDP-N-acetylglucosamine/UDP-N-acetylgalactosamine 4-epimerase
MTAKAFHSGSLSNFSFLVTGGAGFIGSHITEYLLLHKAKKVVVMDNLATGLSENIKPFLDNPNFLFIEGDITNPVDCKKACEGIDYISHQAALGSVPRSIEFPLQTHNTNSTGFMNMLVAAKEAGVKRIVYASSSSVYGDSPDLPKKEEKIGSPLSPYAVTKLNNEQNAAVFSRVYQIEIIGLRYFNIFGPRQNPEGGYAAAIPLFINAMIKNEPVYINGDGEQTRDFTFVQNAVQANIKSFFTNEPDAIGQNYNIAVGERISLKELVTILKQNASSDSAVIHRSERKGDIKDSLADISKAKKFLGYEPYVKMEEGLKLTLDWFKTNMEK